MKSFSEWKNNQIAMDQQAGKAFKASKDEIMDHWRKLPPGIPLGQLRAVPSAHTGPTISFDGIRITGSSHWINYVLSKLKDVTNYETEAGGQTRLQVVYKQIIDNKTQQPVPESYVCYVQVHQRENTSKLRVPKLKMP